MATMTKPETTTKRPETALVKQFRTARRVSTPLVAIETPDAGATIGALAQALNGKTPTLQWDAVRGLHGLNSAGKHALQTALTAAGADRNVTVNPVAALEICEHLPSDGITGPVTFFHNFHKQLTDVPTMQALWNLRDIYKLDRRMIVLLGVAFVLPAEIANDIILLEEPLATRDELSAVVLQQYRNANLPLPAPETHRQELDAVVGLPCYTVEQITAMNLTPAGVDVPGLWSSKVKAIQNTKGLHVWKDKGSSLAHLKGIDNAVAYMQELIDADAFGAICFIDEGDKAMKGGMSDYSGDSGVAADQIQQVLSYIEDTDSLGVLLAGVAGTGKTELAKATAASARKPLIIFDLGGMKGGHVGESERDIRTALKVVTATAEGRVLFIMTANKTTIFTPEMNRRFPKQFFFDSPNDAGRAAIWPVHVKAFNLTPEQAAIPPGFDAGWTGAEIRRACKDAALFKKTVVEAARYLIPQAVSAKGPIAELRQSAAGRFLSASDPGWYQLPDEEPVPVAARRIEVS